MSAPRPVKLVIDHAIRENRRWEWLCFVMTATFAASGVGVLIAGAVTGNGLVSLAGAVAAGLFWPAFQAAERLRRANMAIRMMEIPLRNAKTADEAADAIREAFLRVVPKEGP
jgi:hypothetical protein